MIWDENYTISKDGFLHVEYSEREVTRRERIALEGGLDKSCEEFNKAVAEWRAANGDIKPPVDAGKDAIIHQYMLGLLRDRNIAFKKPDDGVDTPIIVENPK